MLTFTLDTNCIVAIDEGRDEAISVRLLADAHKAGRADVAVVAMSASEKQKDRSYLDSFAAFQDRLSALDLGHLQVLSPMCYWDVTFWEQCMWADDHMELLEQEIHKIAFPSMQLAWPDYCEARGLDPQAGIGATWKNAKCDVQLMWTHTFNRRDVFVSSDKNFHLPAKKSALVALGAGRIEYPLGAASLL